MAKKEWNKEEACAVIRQYEVFPELWNITLPEYRYKEFKGVKLKKYQRACEFKISKFWE